MANLTCPYCKTKLIIRKGKYVCPHYPECLDNYERNTK